MVSPRRIVPGVDDLGVEAAEAQLLADADVDEAQRLLAEAGGELGAAGVRLVGDLDHGVADGEAGASRQVVGADVEVDVELVAGQGPDVVVVTADEPGQPGVDDVELHVGMGAAVVGAPAAPHVPGVADDALGRSTARPRRGPPGRRPPAGARSARACRWSLGCGGSRRARLRAPACRGGRGRRRGRSRRSCRRVWQAESPRSGRRFPSHRGRQRSAWSAHRSIGVEPVDGVGAVVGPRPRPVAR